MNGVRHPFTDALYEPVGDGTVMVTLHDRTGRFTSEGRWLDGELREADPHLCGWVAGRRVTSHRVTAKAERGTNGSR